jgi:alkylresorcinol/alkylpyrone synthase
LGVATSVPPYILDQEDVGARVRAIFVDRFPSFDRVANVFTTAGIRKRHAVRPIEWYLGDNGWPERTAAYLASACDLFVEAAGKALALADLSAADVDCIVTVSSTGIATPSLDARVYERMGFRRDVRRVPVFGLGCAGGVTGLSIASRLAEASPGSRVLLVAVECCTLSSRLDALTKANIVALALFADGAAAVVLSTDPGASGGHGRITASSERIWPGTLDIMGWSVDPTGFGVIFDQSIPVFAQAHMAGAIDSMLAESNVSRGSLDRLICHPGGRKVIEAIETSLDLPDGSLVDERTVLANYGNMSAPTVLFVLERAVAAGLPRRSLMTALGPGFTLSTAILETGTP